MIYLISLSDHAIQSFPIFPYKNEETNNHVQQLYERCIDIVHEYGIGTIAEEFSEEAKRCYCSYESVAEKICNEHSLIHIFADPTTAQRVEDNIDDDDWASREEYWINKIQEESDSSQPVLFLFGAAHEEGLIVRLKEEKIEFEILNSNF